MMKQAKKNICALCSLGCPLVVEVDDGCPVAMDYLVEAPATRGKLCAKGNYALELLNHPLRVEEPGKGRLTMNWDEAAAIMARTCASLRAALVVEGDLSEEEAALLPTFGRKVLRSPHYALNFPTGDNLVVKMLNNLPVPEADIGALRNSECTVAVNDPFSVGPVIAGPVMAARNAARQNTLNVISPGENLASRFAAIKLFGSVRKNLLCLLEELAASKPGPEPAWVAGSLRNAKRTKPEAGQGEIQQLSARLISSGSSVFVLSTYDPVAAGLAACCALLAGAKVFLVNDYPNAKNISGIFAGMSAVEEILDAVEAEAVDALIILGSDLVASYPERNVAAILKKLKFLAVGAVFPNKTTALADIILPTALWLEKDGTFKGEALAAVAEPAGAAKSYGEILGLIANAARIKLEPQAIPPVKPPATVPRELIATLITEGRAMSPETAILSSSVTYADDSLTGRLSFPRACRAETL